MSRELVDEARQREDEALRRLTRLEDELEEAEQAYYEATRHDESLGRLTRLEDELEEAEQDYYEAIEQRKEIERADSVNRGGAE